MEPPSDVLFVQECFVDYCIILSKASFSSILEKAQFIFLFWSTSELRVRLAPWIRFKPSSKIFLLTVPSRHFFCGSFVLFMSWVCYAFASVHCCFLVICWKRLTSWLSFVFCCVFCHFSMWYPGSGVVHDCVESWSLPSFLLEITKLAYILNANKTSYRLFRVM